MVAQNTSNEILIYRKSNATNPLNVQMTHAEINNTFEFRATITYQTQKVMGDYVYKFWHLLDETLNAILFILIGLEIIPVLQNFDFSYLIIVFIMIVVVVLSRAVGVFVPIKILSIKKTFEKNTALIITWGGLRGGLSIALALNLPESIGTGKDLILILSYGVVLFTILVQGLTLKKIIK